MTTSSSARSGGVFGYALIFAVGVAIAAFVNSKGERDMAAAIERYRTTSRAEAQDHAQALQLKFTQLYQGIRTISLLPSVKTIDRYGKNLDDNAHESIIQIYNNLRSNVTVSEVYVVPVDIEPEQIDPVTGSLQTPILMFDDAVAAHEEDAPGAEEEKITTIAQAEVAPEVEIFEYRALKEQMQYLKQHYDDISTVDKMNLPMIGSPSVLTCDNGDYEKTNQDKDRSGAMLSVPFYGADGKLKGTVTTVLRDNIMREMLPQSHAALVNSEYNYNISAAQEGQQNASEAWVSQKKPDPSLLFSEVIEVATPDPRSKWVFWAGYPDAIFYESGDAKAVENFRLFGYGFAGLFTLVGFGIYAMIRRNFRAMERNNAELERKVAERAAEIEQMMAQQERQKAEAEAERRKMLHKMADQFESSVAGVLSQVVSASSQMQGGSQSVTQIADDTKNRSDSVARAASEAAHTSSQVSAAAEELTASIAEISSQTQKSSRVATTAAGQAAQAKEAIETLSSQSNKVGEIVSMIDTISGQINLLALNATIESARAGDAGKGFAVVAGEVKNLASQVGRATGEISAQIAHMQQATHASVDRVMTIIRTIDEMSGSIQAVASAVEEQTAVTNEIARNIALTAMGAQDISTNITSVQDGAQKTGSTASEVLRSAQELGRQSAILREKVEEFLRTVRA